MHRISMILTIKNCLYYAKNPESHPAEDVYLANKKNSEIRYPWTVEI